MPYPLILQVPAMPIVEVLICIHRDVVSCIPRLEDNPKWLNLLTSESRVLMSPIAVVREWNILMGRITVVSKDGRPRGFLSCWAGLDAGKVRCVKNCIFVRNLRSDSR